MIRIAIEVRDLISSNLSSALAAATDPAKLLSRLQREIEEALIAVHGDISHAERERARVEARHGNTETRAKDWEAKARIAMDHGREDLARQALLTREECRAVAAQMGEEVAAIDADLADARAILIALEAKRSEIRQQVADQRTSNDAYGRQARTGVADRAEQRMDELSAIERRTAFAGETDNARCRGAALDREIDKMRRDSAVDAELAAMRASLARPAARTAKRKSG